MIYGMAPLYLRLCAFAIIILCVAAGTGSDTQSKGPQFDENYVADWGAQHITFLDQGREVQILIDENSGGGFRSRVAYGSGHFGINMKIPANSGGIVTTFYLTSTADNGPDGNHDEVDFELLGHHGHPYILSTNVFAQDSGHREQQIKLWFDPTLDFHQYQILWNQHQIVFFVDDIPIRVFKNLSSIGAKFPNLPMFVHGSLWNATRWLGPTDWNLGPFIASYRTLLVNGCLYENSDPKKCASLEYFWNALESQHLTRKQQRLYKEIRNKRIVYDYCKSKTGHTFPECQAGK